MKKRPLREYKGYLIRGELPLANTKKPRRCSIDLTGQKFGKLTVIEEVGILSGRRRLWGCICDCGGKRAATQSSLRSGSIKSCGCLMVAHIKSLPINNKLKVGEACFNRLYKSYRFNARIRKHCFDLSMNEFRLLVESPCHYCGSERASTAKAKSSQMNGDYAYTGIDRINNMLGYTKENSRPCCKQCNLAKHSNSELNFKEWLKRAYLHWAQAQD